MRWLTRLLDKWFKQKCVHWWRPAMTSKGAAKHCDDCGITVQLTESEFYALFGRMPIL